MEPLNAGKSLDKGQKKVYIQLGLLLLLILASLFTYQFITANPPYELILNAFYTYNTYYTDYLDVEIAYSPDDQRVTYHATLTIKPEDNSSGFFWFALSNNLNIQNAYINDEEVRVKRIWLLNIVTIPKELRHQEFQLELSYSGTPSSTFLGSKEGFVSDSGVYLSANDIWLPFMFRKTPGKIQSMYTITTPEGLVSVTAGAPLSTKTVDGMITQVWADTGLASVLIQDYDLSEYNGSKNIRVFTPSGYQDTGLYIAQLADEIIKLYESHLGTIGPANINIAFSEGSFSGYFDSGLMTLNSSNLRKVAQDPHNEDFYRLLAHELAHLWWHSSGLTPHEMVGNQWLVEGFAEFAAMWSTGQRYGMEAYLRRLDSRITRLSSETSLKPLINYTYWERSNVPYHKGPLMLESLRRSEGEKKVLEFLRLMSVSPEQRKTVSTTAEIADQVFEKDYGLFFSHWLTETEPVKLEISSFSQNTEGNGIIELTSNQELTLPLEVCIIYPDRIELQEFSIKAGINQLLLHIADNAIEIRIDPNRRLFRLDPIFEPLKIAIEPKAHTLDQAIANLQTHPVRVWQDSTHSIDDILESSDHWVTINKHLDMQSHQWSVDYILEDTASLWAILTWSSDNVKQPRPIRQDFFLTSNTDHSRWSNIIISEPFLETGEARFLVNWIKGTQGSAIGGQRYELKFDTETESTVMFTTPLVPYPRPSLKYTGGGSIYTPTYEIGIVQVEYGPLETRMQLMLKGKNGWNTPDLVSFDFVLADGTVIPPANSIKRIYDDHVVLDISARLKTTAHVPLGIRIYGIAQKQPESPVISYGPGGILWSGLEDEQVIWDNTDIQVPSNHGLALMSMIPSNVYIIDSVSVHPIVNFTDSQVRFGLKFFNSGIETQNIDFYLGMRKSDPWDLKYSKEDLIAELEILPNERQQVPLQIPNQPGMYTLIGASGYYVASLGQVLVYDVNSLLEEERQTRLVLDSWIEMFKTNRDDAKKALEKLNDNLPSWYDFFTRLPIDKDWEASYVDITYETDWSTTGLKYLLNIDVIDSYPRTIRVNGMKIMP